MQHLTIGETLALLRMGHSEQEIMDYINEKPGADAPNAELGRLFDKPTQPDPQPQAQPDPQPDPQPQAQPDPQPQAQPDPQPQAQPAQPQAPGIELDRLYAKLTELTSAIQAGNRASVDMSANIIDPMQAGRESLARMGNLIKEDNKK